MSGRFYPPRRATPWLIRNPGRTSTSPALGLSTDPAYAVCAYAPPQLLSGVVYSQTIGHTDNTFINAGANVGCAMMVPSEIPVTPDLWQVNASLDFRGDLPVGINPVFFTCSQDFAAAPSLGDTEDVYPQHYWPFSEGGQLEVGAIQAEMLEVGDRPGTVGTHFYHRCFGVIFRNVGNSTLTLPSFEFEVMAWRARDLLPFADPQGS